jgi:hypothetical protein
VPELTLRFDPGHARDPVCAGLLHHVLEQGRLADAGFTAQHNNLALTRQHSGHEAIQPAALRAWRPSNRGHARASDIAPPLWRSETSVSPAVGPGNQPSALSSLPATC